MRARQLLQSIATWLWRVIPPGLFLFYASLVGVMVWAGGLRPGPPTREMQAGLLLLAIGAVHTTTTLGLQRYAERMSGRMRGALLSAMLGVFAYPPKKVKQTAADND
jgi:hypothetical protein